MPPDLRSSVPIVVSGNLVSGAIGLAVGLLAARTLGADVFGGLGVALAIYAIVANVLDVRLTDIASRLYFRVSDSIAAASAHDVLAAATWISLASGLAIAIVGSALAVLSVEHFTSVSLGSEVLLLLAVSEAASAPIGTLMLVHRLSDRVIPMTIFQVANAAQRGLLVATSLLLMPGAEGYAVALAAAACVGIVLALGFARATWPGGFNLFPGRGRLAVAFGGFRSEFRLAVSANLMGYAKMLHRGGDTLLVGWFASDAQTGAYRLARSLCDALLMVYEAINRVYQPLLMRWIQERSVEAFRLAAFRLFCAGTAGMGIAQLVVALVGERVLELVVGPTFAGLVPMLVLHLTTLFFTIGVQVWLWPIVLAGDGARSFAYAQIGAVLVGQYGLGVLMSLVAQDRAALWIAIGHIVAYVLMFGFAWRRQSRQPATAQFFPRFVTR